MENEVKKSASKVWLVPTIIAVVLLIGLVVFMVIMGKGTSALADGTVTLSEAVSPLQDGTAQLSDGVDQYTGGVDTMNDAMPTLVDGVKQYTEGVDQLNGYMAKLNGAAPTLASGVKQLADGSTTLKTGVDTYTGGVDKVANGIALLNGKVPDLIAGINQLDSTLEAGLTEKQQKEMVKTVEKTIKDSFANEKNPQGTAAIKKQATEQLNAQLGTQLDAGKEAAAAGLLADAGFNGVVTAGVQSIAVDTQVKPVILATVNTNLSTYGLQYASLDELDAAWNTKPAQFGGYMTLGTAITQSPTVTYSQFMDAQIANALATNEQLKAGINGNVNAVATGAAGGIIDGVKESVSEKAVPMLADTIAGATLQGALGAGGTVAVTVGNQTMATIREAIQPLVAGAPDLAGGIQQLFDGSQQLKANSGALRDGAGQLAGGIGTLNSSVNGKDGLVSSVAQLYKDGSNKLAENSQALRDGVKQLSDGAKQLADNSQALRDGAAQLKDAAPALIDGIGQLVDGAKKVNGFTPIH